MLFESHWCWISRFSLSGGSFFSLRLCPPPFQVQIDPYLEDSMCQVCLRQPGPFFCRDQVSGNSLFTTCWWWSPAGGSTVYWRAVSLCSVKDHQWKRVCRPQCVKFLLIRFFILCHKFVAVQRPFVLSRAIKLLNQTVSSKWCRSGVFMERICMELYNF